MPFWPKTPGEGPVAVPSKVDFAALDHAVLDHWKDRNVFQRTISEREGCKDFVAYDGPPGTNGTPHIGHMMQSALKDLWPRYKTMQGYRVLRKAGWDTHGLPIELTAEKELGFKTKRDIEAYGVEKYIDYCRSTVYRYRDEWIKAIKRIGRFLDTDDDYATFRKEYIETDWWVLKQAWDKGSWGINREGKNEWQRLLYKDHKILPYCCRCGTSLSQHEVAQGYKDIQDLSIYAKFLVYEDRAARLIGDSNKPLYWVAWTTTPWTLLSNVALAIGIEVEYVVVETATERLILAKDRLEALGSMIGEYRILKTGTGYELTTWSLTYHPLWDFQIHKDGFPFVVVDDNYVTSENGSGVVHLAAYGEDDLRLIKKHGLKFIQNVDLEGKVTASVARFGGQNFHERDERGDKKLDLDILKDLASRGLLFGKEKITHSYPHCYRCDTPLMYFAKSGWFLRTSALKEEMLAANQKINWFPEHIKEGRFGNWLENNVDWNISRDRYWGSPIPIWTCSECGYSECVGSIQELRDKLTKSGWSHDSLFKDEFDPHKPGIDQVFYSCPKCKNAFPDTEKAGRQIPWMTRTPEVLDCWFNAGIMPWGQYGKETFGDTEAKEQLQHDPSRFPADFICEAIDQTRGWFYTMLATSVLITTKKEDAGTEPRDTGNAGLRTRVEGFSGGLSSFNNVICTEHVTDAQGLKMSKSKGNVIEPIALCDKYGADAVRWSFYNTNPWTARRFTEADLGEVLKQILIPYWNCYSFFVTYAKVDCWKPGQDLDTLLTNPLDRWILSRLVSLDKTVRQSLDGYDVMSAAQAFAEYLDDLTNWYIRRSRRRFWKSEDDGDKQLAYKVLYQVLTSMNRMLAPFIPFVSEVVYQNLERGFDASQPDSVHLSDWPAMDTALRDESLEAKMATVRKVVTMAHSIRADNKVRVRQPLSEVVVPGMPEYMLEFEELILDELNIKHLRRVENESDIMSWKAKGDFKSLGPKFGAKAKEVASAIDSLDHDAIARFALSGEMEIGGVKLGREDVILSQEPIAGYWIRVDGGMSVGISNIIDAELISEWLAREFVHHIQGMRRDAGLEVTDRIGIEYCGDRGLRDAWVHHIRYVAGETLAESIVTTLQSDAEEVRIGDKPCRVKIRPF